MSLLAPVSIPNLLHLSLCQMLDSCRAVICEENKNKSFVALTRGNSINKTRPFAADLLIVLQCRVFVAHAEILVLAKYREKDRRSPGICRSAAVFVIGLAECLHQTLHDTRFHISIFTIVAKYWLRALYARLVSFESDVCKHSKSGIMSLTCWWQKTDKLYWGRKWFSWWSELEPLRANKAWVTRPPRRSNVIMMTAAPLTQTSREIPGG